MLLIAAGALVGYLIGSIPPGYIYLRLTRGVDIRQVESGRTGATNAFRAGGMAAGLSTGLLDIFKGFAAVWAATALLGGRVEAAQLPWLQAAAGVMAVVGHNWPIYLRFQGGAGTTPNIGWASFIWWPLFPINFIVGALALRLLGMASVASIIVAVLIPIELALLHAFGLLENGSFAYAIGGVITGATVMWALRPNIRRLLDGTERVVGPRARRRAAQAAREKQG